MQKSNIKQHSRSVKGKRNTVVRQHFRSKTASSKKNAYAHIGEKNGNRYSFVKRVNDFKDDTYLSKVAPTHYGILAKRAKGGYMKIVGTPTGSSTQAIGNKEAKKLLRK